MADAGGASGAYPSDSSSHILRARVFRFRSASAAAAIDPPPLVPVIGGIGTTGSRQVMEDAFSIHTNLCSPIVNAFQPIHYLAVFDGHGGPYYAAVCKNQLHVVLEEELSGLNSTDRTWAGVLPPPPRVSPSGNFSDSTLVQEYWDCIMTRTFLRTEASARRACNCGGVGLRCRCNDDSVVVTSGTTALVVVITDSHIVVANCGDSRAVLYRRGGVVVPLSSDHKPDRADERARIESHGGRVVYRNTAPLVEGVQAVSRAIGDWYLKPYLTSVPEVTIARRDELDEFVIAATDGVWDVMHPEMAGDVVRSCFARPPLALRPPPGQPFPSRSACGATMLMQMATARGSNDNICAVVADLKRVTQVDDAVINVNL